MRNKKNIIMIFMCVAILFMVIVYALFQTTLKITGTGNITTTWRVEITDVKSSFTGTAYDIETPFYSGATATFHAGLYKPGDKVDYSITVSNTGDVDAIIENVTIDTDENPYIIYSVSDLQYGVTLAKDTSTTFTLSVEFDANSTIIPDDTTKDIIINIIAVQEQDQQLTPGTPSID